MKREIYSFCVYNINPNPQHPWDISGNKIYNNIFYNGYEDYLGKIQSSVLYIYKRSDYEHDIKNNEFSNNIILDWQLNEGHEIDLAVIIIDGGGIGDITGNTIKNNCFYKAGGATGNIIYHQGTLYTASSWNIADPGGNIVDGNIAVDPGLEDPANGKFWSSSESSNVVNAGAAGYDLLGLVSSTTWTPSISIVESSRVKDGNLPDIGPYEWTDSTAYKKNWNTED
jgi:hypothetical protein